MPPRGDYHPWTASTQQGEHPHPFGEDVVAVLDVESDLAQAFDRGQVITLETLADGIGIILRNAELPGSRGDERGGSWSWTG